jgi:hypothetical protein
MAEVEAVVVELVAAAAVVVAVAAAAVVAEEAFGAAQDLAACLGPRRVTVGVVQEPEGWAY